MTTLQLWTLGFIGAVTAVVGIYDIFARLKGGAEATISRVATEFGRRYLIVPVVVGVVVGHIFWDNCPPGCDMSSSDVKLDTKGLEALIKALKSPPVVRVGILGDKAHRSSEGKDGAPSNAQIGAWHEFGTSRLPQRSFLRIPISENLNKALEKSGAFSDDVTKEVVKSKSLRAWLEKVAVVAEGIVFEAFDTGGFGKWPPWRAPNYQNNTGMVLVDTQQLRNSITSEVKGGD